MPALQSQPRAQPRLVCLAAEEILPADTRHDYHVHGTSKDTSFTLHSPARSASVMRTRCSSLVESWLQAPECPLALHRALCDP